MTASQLTKKFSNIVFEVAPQYNGCNKVHCKSAIKALYSQHYQYVGMDGNTLHSGKACRYNIRGQGRGKK